MRKKNVIINSALIVIFVLLGVSLFWLFYHQANFMNYGGKFPSDLEVHITMSLLNEGSYSLISFLFRMIYEIAGSRTAIVLCLVGINLCMPIIIAYYIDYGLKESKCVCDKRIILIISVALMFVCAVYIPVLVPYFYTKSRITQTWHNQTYLLMRVFGMMALIYYLKIEKNYLKKIQLKDAIIFTAFLTIANAIKPNFILFFAPMMLIYLIRDFVIKKGKGTVQMIKFGSCVLISLVVVLVQGVILFPEEGNSGIAFWTEGLISFCTSWQELVTFFASLIFPILTLYLTKVYKLKSEILDKAWIMYGIAFFEAHCITETGSRAAHGNFFWGLFFAALILFITSMTKFIELCKKREVVPEKKYSWCFVCAKIGFGLNILSGLIYYVLLLTGENFYI